LITTLAACGGAARPAEQPLPHPAPARDAALAVEQWVREVTASYERADATTLGARLDPDGVFVGPGGDEVWDTAGYRDAQTAAFADLKPGTWHITNKDLRASVAPDGKSAWMRDTLMWDWGDGSGPHPFRWTAVLVNQQYKAAGGKRNGGASVHFAPGGQLGWVVANVDMTIEYDGKPVVFPSRTLVVYVHGANGWKIVQIHSSNAVPG
jgi:ketosteroid isomerase-like protein